MILRKIGNRFSLWPTYPDDDTDDTDDENDDADVGHDISDDDDDSFNPMQRKRRSQGELAKSLHLVEARTSINVLRLQFYRSPKGKTCSSSFLFQVFQMLHKLWNIAVIIPIILDVIPNQMVIKIGRGWNPNEIMEAELIC